MRELGASSFLPRTTSPDTLSELSELSEFESAILSLSNVACSVAGRPLTTADLVLTVHESDTEIEDDDYHVAEKHPPVMRKNFSYPQN